MWSIFTHKETPVIAGKSYPVLNKYDSASNIVNLIYPNGENVTYTYDALELVLQVGTWAANPHKGKPPLISTLATFTYTLDDKIKTITYQNGLVTRYSYDSRDRPSSIQAVKGTAAMMVLNYTYDGVGNVLSINSEKFAYDYLNRLSSANSSWGSISYAYDPVGNMLSQTSNGVKTSYSYSSYNRLVQAGSAIFSYDSNGNTIKIANGSNTYTYSYDYESRLTGVAKNGVTLQNNTYDSDGARIEKSLGSSSVVYAYEGASTIFEENLSSSAVTDRVYANGLQIAMIASGVTYYYTEDALGSTRLVTTSSVSSVFSSDYYPYGRNYNLTFSLNVNFMYTGKMEDEESGLYYYGARFYNPSIQRFMTEDAVVGSLSDPLTLNRYTYVVDNPETLTDATGHMYYYQWGGGGGGGYYTPTSSGGSGGSSTSTLGSTSNVQNSQIVTQKTSFGQWLVTTDLTNLALYLGLLFATAFSAVAAELGPSVFQMIEGLVLAGTLGANIGTLAAAFASGNAGQLAGGIVSLITGVLFDVVARLSWWQALAVSTTAAAEAASDTALVATIVGSAAFFESLVFFGTAYYQWGSS